MTELSTMTIRKGVQVSRRTTVSLNETNDLLIGQVFNAVADFYGKTRGDYPRWISYEKNLSEFNIIKERIEECATDLEKVHVVCDWLGEDAI